MSKLGVGTLKGALISLIIVANSLDKALKDGFQPISDLMVIVPPMLAIPDILNNKKEVIAEALDLDEDEIMEIANEIPAELGFGSEKAKAAVRKAAIVLGNIIEGIVDLRSVASTPS